MSNFEFLKKIDKDLYSIAVDAEKLYRDEYFEQCMGQTRRLGENICRQVLEQMGKAASFEDTFDTMINNLKDKGSGSAREKEFIEDLYFLKKAGNESVHSCTVKKDGIIALECLQRAFEAALNYALVKTGPDSKLLKLQYDENLLVLGIKNKVYKKKTLQEKYLEKKKNFKEEETTYVKKTSPKSKEPTPCKKTSKKEKNFSFYQWTMDNIFTISVVAIILFLAYRVVTNN